MKIEKNEKEIVVKTKFTIELENNEEIKVFNSIIQDAYRQFQREFIGIDEYYKLKSNMLKQLTIV